MYVSLSLFFPQGCRVGGSVISMILEESKHARNIRVYQKVAFRILAAILTIGLLTMDLFVVFSSTVAHRSITREDELITLSVGPLITRMCSNVTHSGGFGGEGNGIRGGSSSCMSILFYQVPIDDYATSSATLMIALWVPIIAALILTRLTFWRVHAPLQFVVSCGFLGVIYILIRDGYTPGISAAIILGRVSWTAIFVLVFIAMTIIKCCREKYCLGVSDQPAIIGVAYTRGDGDDGDGEGDAHLSIISDDSEDMLSAGYWHEQKRVSVD